MDKSREQFEKWYRGLNLPEGITDERLLDIYKRMLLTAWTVSRREIELPIICGCCYSEEQNFLADEIYSQLGEQGVGG